MSDGNKMNMIQTDCAINSGNPAVLCSTATGGHRHCLGQVFLQRQFLLSLGRGLGFAIPMDDVADMVSELVTNGYVTGKPLMGISVGDVAEDVQGLRRPGRRGGESGHPGLCREKAGLQEGDIITKINDTEVASGNDLITAKDNYKPGDTVNLTVYRDGKTITVKLTLEESTPEKQPNRTKPRRNMKNSSSNSCSKEQQQGSGGWPFGGFGVLILYIVCSTTK